MNIAAALAGGAAQLAAAGLESPRLEARVLLAAVLGVPSGEVRGLSRALTSQEHDVYEAYLARRVAREPLAYIVGHKEFWSLDFEVGSGALVPRPETETLIEQALETFPDRAAPLRVLDLGTGSGCLLVTALSLYPHATGTGVDLSGEALSWARRNAARHGVAARTCLVEGGWDAAAGQVFDLVLANPPYLTADEMGAVAPELHAEPRLALEAGPDGLTAYRALGPAIMDVLAPAGRAFLEIGAGQGDSAPAALAAGGLEILGLIPDLSGHPRCIAARRGG